MGILSTILYVGVGSYIVHSVRKNDRENREERERIQEEETRRKNCFCYFEDGITQDEFKKIVKREGKKIRRISELSSQGLVVYGTVVSQSHISEWDFTIDFNDYGHFTGWYKVSSNNNDSDIPYIVASNISKAVKEIIHPRDVADDQEEKEVYEGEVVEETEEAVHENVIHECKNQESSTPKFYSDFEIVAAPDSKKKPFKHWKLILVLILIIVILAFGGSLFYMYSQRIPVRYEANELLGIQNEIAEEKLMAVGFTNIYLKEINDLTLEEKDKDGIVTDIVIEKEPLFDSETKILADTQITIVSHSLINLYPPINFDEIEKYKADQLKEMFLDKGFTQVKLKPQYDLITGWINEEGDIDKITIDGQEEFSKSDTFGEDAKVIINYHTYIKDKKK